MGLLPGVSAALRHPGYCLAALRAAPRLALAVSEEFRLSSSSLVLELELELVLELEGSTAPKPSMLPHFSLTGPDQVDDSAPPVWRCLGLRERATTRTRAPALTWIGPAYAAAREERPPPERRGSEPSTV